MLTVNIEFDSDLENPADFDCNWTPYSFCRRHVNFKDPEEFMHNGTVNIGLRRKLKVGLAFWLSYYEHGQCAWMRANGPITPGVEFQWDGVRQAGVLIWENKPNEIGGKTYEERARDADTFIKVYNCWCNGEGYYYCIEDEDGEHLDSCGGFFGCDTDYMIRDYIAPQLIGKEYTVTGDGEHLKDDIESIVADLVKEGRKAVVLGS